VRAAPSHLAAGGRRSADAVYRGGAAVDHGAGLDTRRSDGRGRPARAPGATAQARAVEPVLMRTAVLADPLDFDGWREAARRLRLAGVEPSRVKFAVGATAGGLFDEGGLPEVEDAFTAPRA